MACECNLKANRIGVITIKHLRDFQLKLNEATKEYSVTGKDGHPWGRGHSPEGAIISACHCGIPLKDIAFNNHYVKKQTVMKALKA